MKRAGLVMPFPSALLGVLSGRSRLSCCLICGLVRGSRFEGPLLRARDGDLPSAAAVWKIDARSSWTRHARCAGPWQAGQSRVSRWDRHRRDIHRLCAVRSPPAQDVGAQAPDDAARSLRGGHRRGQSLTRARERRHRRCQRHRAWHHACYQCSHRAPWRGYRHAGDGRVPRHPRYGFRTPLRPVRSAGPVSAAVGSASAASGGGGTHAIRRQRRAAAR